MEELQSSLAMLRIVLLIVVAELALIGLWAFGVFS